MNSRAFAGRLSIAAFVAAFVLLAVASRVQAQSVPAGGAHPHGTRTGLTTVDQVIEALETGAPLGGVLQGTPMECATSPQGLGGTYCPDGVPDGTVVDAVFTGQCELVGRAVEDPVLEESLQEILSGDFYLFAVASHPGAGSPGIEGGRYSVYVTSGPDSDDWRRIVVGDSGVIAVSAGCGDGLDVGSALAAETDVVFPPAGARVANPTPTPRAPGTGTAGLSDGNAGGRPGAEQIAIGAASAGAAALLAARFAFRRR